MKKLAILSLLAACTTYLPVDTDRADDERGELRAWAPQDAPGLLEEDLVFDLAALPLQGEAAAVPWAGSYWPTYEDSVNHRWAGDESLTAVEKYAKAFDLDADALADRVSAAYGIDSIQGESCSGETSCGQGSACALREGETEGTCIETWFGICHAWAPAAILEAEPAGPVTYNGVTFEVNDLKALATLQYDRSLETRFMSLRCNADATDDDFALDAHGNPVEQACADTNAGSFHVVITNLLGLQARSLVEDRTYDVQVWNQPIRGYRIESMETVDGREAAHLAGDDEAAAYPFNDDAVSFRHVTLTLEYIGESHSDTDGHLGADIDRYTFDDTYTYVLELDGTGQIIGGEWTGDSKTAHPDFLWLPVAKHEAEVAAGDEAHSGIRWSAIDALLGAATGADSEGFNWGASCDAGEGSFGVDVAKEESSHLGTLPAGKNNVRIDLASDADLDIQLWDGDTPLIAWPEGELTDADEACMTLDDATLCYSGYNGDGDNLGDEWITIEGELGRPLSMAVFGYTAGTAAVLYAYDAPVDCVDAGEGSFAQPIVEADVQAVGILPAGKEDLTIELSADADVDLQLFAGNTPLVHWPDGLLSDADGGSVTWEGVTIHWSGYAGEGDPGHETLTVEGALPQDLILKAYGYAGGEAEVHYTWGQ